MLRMQAERNYILDDIWLQTSSIIKNLVEDNKKLQKTLLVIQSFKRNDNLNEKI